MIFFMGTLRMPTKVPTGLILIYVLHICMSHFCQSQPAYKRLAPIEILKIPTMPREKILIHFLEIINGGIENNVLTDTIRGSFRISENHKRRLQMLSSILNRMNSDCFSSDDILIEE